MIVKVIDPDNIAEFFEADHVTELDDGTIQIERPGSQPDVVPRGEDAFAIVWIYTPFEIVKLRADSAFPRKVDGGEPGGQANGGRP